MQVNTPLRRRALFAALYFSEGAPIGFIWWALPTRLRAAGVAVEEITALTATLTLPWALKFLWSPAVDALQNRWWTLRQTIIAAQLLMIASLVPLIGVDPAAHFDWLRNLLLLHAFTAATQDVAIDAWCVRMTPAEEHGRINGWMQAGMLVGRSLLGGGALYIASRIGETNVVLLLCLAIASSLVLLLSVRAPEQGFTADESRPRHPLLTALRMVARSPSTWMGLAYALTAGAAFEALGAVHGPLLVDAGWTENEIGRWLAVPVVAAMVVGSLVGGRLADRYGHVRVAATALLVVALFVGLAGITVLDGAEDAAGRWLPVFLASQAIGVGVLTASSYALLMDLCDEHIAATQFSTYMAAGNGCEIWAGWLVGRLAGQFGYGRALLTLAGLSLWGLCFLAGIVRQRGGRRGRAAVTPGSS